MKKPSKSKPRRLESHKEVVARITEQNRAYFARLDGKKQAARPRRLKSQKKTDTSMTEASPGVFSETDGGPSSNKPGWELVEQAGVETIRDENPAVCFEESKNYPAESGGAARLVYICPHCHDEMTYAPECHSLVAQCPNCQNLLILGRATAPEDLPARNAFRPFFPEVKTTGNHFFSDSSVSVKFAILVVWAGFFIFVVWIYRNERGIEAGRNGSAALARQQIEYESQQNPATTPADPSSSSPNWTENAFADGSTWNSAAAKWDSAQSLSQNPKTSDYSDLQTVNVPLEFSGQSIEATKNSDISK
jgi:hypothetical protein